MGSSPTDPTTASPSPVAFALQELIACWDQGYEALAQGDLDRVAALLEVADDHLAGTVNGAPDSEVAVPITFAPACAKAIAIALPIPREAPVTNAT